MLKISSSVRHEEQIGSLHGQRTWVEIVSRHLFVANFLIGTLRISSSVRNDRVSRTYLTTIYWFLHLHRQWPPRSFQYNNILQFPSIWKSCMEQISSSEHVLGQHENHGAMPERQTEISSPELKLLKLSKLNDTAFSVCYLFNTKWMNQVECRLRIVRASNRARKYVMVQQGKSPNEAKT